MIPFLLGGLMGGDKEGDNPAGRLKLTYNKRCLSNQEPKFVTSSLAKKLKLQLYLRILLPA